MIKPILRRLFKTFMEGLLIVVPFGLTVFFVLRSVNYLREKVQEFFNFLVSYLPYVNKVNSVPFLNLILILAFITLLGYIASNFLVKSLLHILEQIIMTIPLVNILYSYIKDSTSAFMDKFDKPVLITTNKELGMQKLGFITQESLEQLPVSENRVAVYMPHSYSFSGELMLIDKQHVEYLSISSTDAMRLILSGGISNIETKKKEFVEIGEKVESIPVKEVGDKDMSFPKNKLK